MVRTTLALLLLAIAVNTQAQVRPFVGTYQTKYGMLSATGDRRLDALPDGRWKMENHAKVLMVDVAERSTFTMADGKVHSLSYDFINPLSKDRSMSNSRRDRVTSCPATQTRRPPSSITTSPTTSWVSSGSRRRRMARSRASSSSSANGFTR